MRPVVLALVVALCGVVAFPSPADAGSRPELRLVGTSPLTLVGTGFRSGERIRLLVTPGLRERTLRAGARGGFRLALSVRPSACGALVVQALGVRGSRATIDRPGLDCAPVDG